MLPPATLRLIDLALDEDLGRGDPTSEAIFPAGARAAGAIVAKQELVLAGVEVARAVFARVDPRIEFFVKQEDGARLGRGAEVASVAGEALAVLAAERPALNFLQRLSGVATLTRRFVDAVAGTR